MKKPFTNRVRTLPTREDLDRRNSKRATLVALGMTGTLVTLATLWWTRHGAALVENLVFQAQTIHLYWTLVATSTDRAVWITILSTLALGAALIMFLIHRFVWRAFFPDLRRLDTRTHTGGVSERVGRLYRVIKFRDGEKTLYRHQYKHGDRWFPLFRLDFIDLDTPAESTQHGVALIRCGTLERDPNGNRFRRIPSNAPNGAAPLGTAFRTIEVQEDQERKMNIVGPGASTNPEVMRRKYREESLSTTWQAEKATTREDG